MRGQPQTLDTGLRRVSWVRIVDDDEGVRAEVAGLRHRTPVVQPVSLATAAGLVHGGVPVVFRRSRVGEQTG